MTAERHRPTLLVVVCGAGPAGEVGCLVALAQRRMWTVSVVLTPAAVDFVDVPTLEKLTGQPVLSQYRSPDTQRVRSAPPSAVIVAPASYNTICKLALGISDTYALGTLAESIGRGIPVVVLPFVNSALAARRPFVSAVESLRAENVPVLLGPGQWEPHPPGTGDQQVATYPWAAALDTATAVRNR